MIVALVFGILCIMVGGGVSQMFQIGYTQLFSNLLYVDQRIRRENLAQALLAELAAQAPGTGTVPTPAERPAEPLSDADAPTLAHPDRPQPRPEPEPDTLPDRPTDD